tara:strand:+ start:2392 stop:2772 length:381 start_codon:yes stop_codon:yes gene_type:complete
MPQAKTDDRLTFKPNPMICNIEIGSSRKKAYKPQPAPPTRKQLTGWTVEQVGPQMWRVFRNSTTQGKQAIIDYPTPEGAQSFADGCNGEHKNPTKMSASSLRKKAKEYLTDIDRADLAALENGEGI